MAEGALMCAFFRLYEVIILYIHLKKPGSHWNRALLLLRNTAVQLFTDFFTGDNMNRRSFKIKGFTQ